MELDSFLRSQRWLSPLPAQAWSSGVYDDSVLDMGLVSFHNIIQTTGPNSMMEPPIALRKNSFKRKIDETDSESTGDPHDKTLFNFAARIVENGGSSKDLFIRVDYNTYSVKYKYLMENSRLVAAQQAIPPCGTDLPITYLKFRNLILCIRPNELNHKKASEKLEVFEEALRKLSDCSPVEDDSSAEFLGDAYDIVRAAKMCHEIFFPSAVHASQLPLQVDALRVLHKAALVSLANLHGKSSKQLLQGQWKDSDSDENLEASAQNWISASELTFIKGKVDAYFSLEEERLSAQLDVVLNRVYCHQPSELRQRKNEKELETLAAELDKTIDGIFKAKEYSTLLSLLP